MPQSVSLLSGLEKEDRVDAEVEVCRRGGLDHHTWPLCPHFLLNLGSIWSKANIFGQEWEKEGILHEAHVSLILWPTPGVLWVQRIPRKESPP